MKRISDFKVPQYTVINELLKLSCVKQYTLEFARYVYIPHNLEEEKNRKIFRISHKEYTENNFSNIISSLKPNEELALQSRIHCGKKVLYLPLIDFLTNKFELITNSLIETLPKRYLDKIYFFNSGRSFHAYIFDLLDKEEWVSFMGTLLLLNKSKAIVDGRWIGHSLRTGYSALRWTNNTGYYKSVPTLYAILQKNKLILNKNIS